MLLKKPLVPLRYINQKSNLNMNYIIFQWKFSFAHVFLKITHNKQPNLQDDLPRHDHKCSSTDYPIFPGKYVSLYKHTNAHRKRIMLFVFIYIFFFSGVVSSLVDSVGVKSHSVKVNLWHWQWYLNW